MLPEAEKFRKATAALRQLKYAAKRSQTQPFFTHRPCFAADSDSEDDLQSQNEDDHPLPSQIKESTGIVIDLPSTTSVPPSQIRYDSVPLINVASSSYLFDGQYCYSQSEYG
ncbi:hypothetical protein C8J56DRAFT_1043088 [Mycena floridula]|nr:hypothetical protein C8J56DRAFT_1043088 [Mycena floridula]